MNQSERLKFIREKLGLSQQGLADSISEKQGKIRDIEIEKQKISPEFAEIMEKIHNVNFKWLLTGEGDPFNKTEESQDSLKVPVDCDNTGCCGTGSFIDDNFCPKYIEVSKF